MQGPMSGTSLPLLLVITVNESKQILENTCVEHKDSETFT